MLDPEKDEGAITEYSKQGEMLIWGHRYNKPAQPDAVTFGERLSHPELMVERQLIIVCDEFETDGFLLELLTATDPFCRITAIGRRLVG